MSNRIQNNCVLEQQMQRKPSRRANRCLPVKSCLLNPTVQQSFGIICTINHRLPFQTCYCIVNGNLRHLLPRCQSCTADVGEYDTVRQCEQLMVQWQWLRRGYIKACSSDLT
mmetsp:Transcript_4379/g.6761  ORF Transcript_4379/g.6761 Transcript_4379/m.6761 type:complete len:112 (-) Transcript_4379:851-1186(-)